MSATGTGSGRRYQLLDLFKVRVTGVPFDVLESIGTPDVAHAGRALLAAERELARAIEAARERWRGADQSIPPPIRTALRKARSVSRELRDAHPELERYACALEARDRAREALARAIEPADAAARERLRRHGLELLPAYLVFESAALGSELDRRGEGGELPPSEARALDRKLLMYLQRVCAKNDSISRFGPVGWGRIAPGAGFAVDPDPGVGPSDVQVERWVVRAFVQAMNGDPDVRAEVAPRRHPCGLREGQRFVRLDLGSELALSDDDARVLDRCDGDTPARALGSLEVLASLAERGIVIWEVELVAWDATPLATLIADVGAWRDGAARGRWAPRLAELDALTRTFAREVEPAARARVASEVVARVEALGAAAPSRAGILYAATNPIIEDCYRECRLALGAETVDTLLRDGAPWFDLFRDVYSLAMTRAYHCLRPLYLDAPRHRGRLSLAAFLPFLARHGYPVEGAGLARVGAEVFRQVKDDFRAEVAGRADAREWQLTADECRFLHRRHELAVIEDGTWPSPDLQLAAASPEAVARGDYDWVVAELHQAAGLLQHCTYWACPDKPRFHAAIARSTAGHPWLAHSRAGFFSSVHAACEGIIDAFPSTFVAPERPRPYWRAVPPAEAEVVLDDEHHDLRVRGPDGSDLGSLTRSAWLFFGFHPFFPLVLPGHTPRLRFGKVIAQRESWAVRWDELGLTKAPATATVESVLAIERLRADRGIPRWVYVRASAGSLDRLDAFARKKDVKPFCVDLESLLSLDVLLRRLEQYGELEVTEMYPAPDQLVWREPAGRFTFELRGLLEPLGTPG